MSRNRSGSYHIQGQIILLQIRTLVFRRYRSQIHYTEVPVGTTGLILNLQKLYLFSDTRVPVGTTELNRIQEYPWVLQDRYRGTFRSLLLFFIQCLIICLSDYQDQS